MKLILTMCMVYLLSIAGCLSVMDFHGMPQPDTDCCPYEVQKSVDTARLDAKIADIERKLKAIETKKAKQKAKTKKR
jgi:hypothetical protein